MGTAKKSDRRTTKQAVSRFRHRHRPRIACLPGEAGKETKKKKKNCPAERGANAAAVTSDEMVMCVMPAEAGAPAPDCVPLCMLRAQRRVRRRVHRRNLHRQLLRETLAMEEEIREQRTRHAAERREALALLEETRRDAPARNEARDERRYLAAERESDVSRALRTMEGDRKVLRVLELRADDKDFGDRAAMNVADLYLPLQPPWNDKPGGIPDLESSRWKPNLTDPKVIHKVARFRSGDRAVLNGSGERGGATEVRVVGIELAHPKVPPLPLRDAAEAVYLVRNDSTTTTAARNGNERWARGDQLHHLAAGATIRHKKWVRTIGAASFDSIREASDQRAAAKDLDRRREARRRAMLSHAADGGETQEAGGGNAADATCMRAMPSPREQVRRGSAPPALSGARAASLATSKSPRAQSASPRVRSGCATPRAFASDRRVARPDSSVTRIAVGWHLNGMPVWRGVH